MVTNDLGACEWFVWDLRRSALIDRGQLDQIVGEFLKRSPRAEAPQLAEHLVNQGTLTAFQAERILNQKTQGLVLGPYVLLDAIGQGSMGQVFKASSKNDNGHYALKVLPRRSMWNVRLARRQVRSFGQFSHPAVVPFVDVGTTGGLHYLVWPLVEGQTLEYLVQQQGRLPAEQSAQIALQIAQGMQAAHQNNIFHGLLKPSNVMLGSDGQARLLDFGIGSLLVENEGESLVDTMSTANTLTSGLDCSSPESVMDPTNRTPAGDQYSLGCTLYFALTGRVPFPEGTAVEKMMAHQSRQPQSILDFAEDCPEGLEQVVFRLMAKTPESRFSGMDEVVEALEPYLGEHANVEERQQVAVAAGSKSRGTGTTKYAANNKASSATSRGFPAAPPQTPSPARAAGGFSAPMPPPKTLPPGGMAKPAAPRAMPTTPPPAAPSRGGGRATVPSRAAFQVQVEPEMTEDEIALTPAGGYPHPDGNSVYSDASKLSAGWVANQPEKGLKPAFGMLGILSAALILGVLVFMGAKILIVQ